MPTTPESIAKMLKSRRENAKARILAEAGVREKGGATARRKYRRRKNHGVVMGPVEEMRNSPLHLPVVEVNGSNSEVAEFAAFMAEAFKIWKSR